MVLYNGRLFHLQLHVLHLDISDILIIFARQF